METIINKRKKNKEAAKKFRERQKQKEINLQAEIILLHEKIREKSVQIPEVVNGMRYVQSYSHETTEFNELKRQFETQKDYVTQLEQFIIRNIKLF